MSWTRERKTFITFILIIFFLTLGIFILLPFIIKEPVCTDGVKNGTETGVDCGGSCGQMCVNDIIPLEIRFERSVQVDEKTYDAVAYLVNKNNTAVPTHVSFKVTLSDRNGSTIATQTGKTFILPGAATPLYVPNISVGERVPVRTRFEITETGPFYSYSNQELLKNIQVVDYTFDNTINTPRLVLTVGNKLFDTVRDIDVYALLYDSEGTVIAINKTYIEAITGQSQEKAYFSWRAPFSSPARFEFILVQKPFTQ